MIHLYFYIQNMIYSSKIFSAAFLTLNTPTFLLSNQNNLLVLNKTFFQLKNIHNIPHAGP